MIGSTIVAQSWLALSLYHTDSSNLYDKIGSSGKLVKSLAESAAATPLPPFAELECTAWVKSVQRRSKLRQRIR